MFNVTVVDGKRILKYIIAVIIIIILTVILRQGKNHQNVKQTVEDTAKQVYSYSYISCMDVNITSMRYLNNINNSEKLNIKDSFISGLLNSELSVNNRIIAKITDEQINEATDNNTTLDIDSTKELINAEIPENITTQVIEENNMKATYTNTYESVEIKNKSGYELTADMLVPDVDLENKKDIVIYHTHTCESYTPTEKFNYQMTGNYRTTDINYSVARVRR